jgi:hypothetical protein
MGLDLSHYVLENLPDEIGQLKQLEIFYLQGRPSIRLVMSFSSSGNAGARSVGSLPPALCRSRSSRRSS